MPRRNKKKQRKEERRKAMKRVRQEKGWQPPPDVEFVDDELTRDLLTFIPELGGDQPPGLAAAETLTDAVLESHHLLDEPEFAMIYFHPTRVVGIYAELEDQRGVTEEMLNSLSEEEEDDLFFDLMEEIARYALTDELQEEIMDAMQAVWTRVRMQGDEEQAGRLAGMMLLLGSEAGEELWAGSGIVQAILRRSLDAGFELLDIMEEAGALRMDLGALVQTGRDEEIQKKFLAVLAKYPGLGDVVSDDEAVTWDRGVQTLMDGELYLGIFTDEELEAGGDLLGPPVFGDSEAEASQARANIQKVQQYVVGWLTPEHRNQVRERLLTMLADEELTGESNPFLMAMLSDLDDEDPDTAVAFLTAAFIGELTGLAEERLDEPGRPPRG